MHNARVNVWPLDVRWQEWPFPENGPEMVYPALVKAGTPKGTQHQRPRTNVTFAVETATPALDFIATSDAAPTDVLHGQT